jgi:hypothetical protein
MARTIQQLMKATPPDTKRLATNVRISAMKVKQTQDGYPVIIAKTQSTVDAKGKVITRPGQKDSYVSTIEVYPKHQVIVDCTCSQHLYRLEYYLNKVGAARIIRSNGEPPTIRATEGGVWLCKHLYALADKLVKAGKL